MIETKGMLKARFRQCFGCEPTVVVRAPGRVNLIGEHTDYNGLPVLPFALVQSHRLAIAANDKPLIELENDDPRYPAKRIVPEQLSAFSRAGEWDNYLRAALLGLMDAGLLDRGRLARGMRILVTSDLPSGVGLSSSSALVVGFALAALQLHQMEFDRSYLADVLAEAEHYVGTRGGGMDQTVCLLGREGHVLRINFFPLEVEAVPCWTGCQPVPLEIFLSDSGVRIEKSGAGLALYNRRPLECRLALAVFKSRARRNDQVALTAVRYWGDLAKPPIALSHEAVLAMIRSALGQTAYSIVDLCRELEMSESSLSETYFQSGAGERLWQEAGSVGLKLRQRAEHVMAEGRRVDEAVEALRNSDWPQLAERIAASHVSCRDLYEISCPELERLVALGKEAGALASRLTGAGFGGCVLHLVRRQDVERFQKLMKPQLGESQKLYRVAPSAGAEVL